MPKPASRALLACCFLAVPPSMAGGEVSDDRHHAGGAGQVKVSLLAGERLVAEHMGQAGSGQLRGSFVEKGLAPGVYTLQAAFSGSQQVPPSTRRQVIVSPDPFDWKSASPE